MLAPASLALAGCIHAAQGARREWVHWRTRKKGTPTTIPEGAGGLVRTQEECISRLPLHEFAPLPIDGYTSTGVRALPELAVMYFDTGRRLRGRLHHYPRHFHETVIPGAGGVPISAMLGLHHPKLRRPGLVVVHGLMNSKRQDLVRIVTLRAFYEWGFNVCAIDMRGFGRSAELSSAATAAGGLEAEDVMAVVRYLRSFNHCSSIGLLGFSLGGGAVLNCAAHKDAEALIDGGVFAVSPPVDLEAALNRFEHPPADHEHLMTYHFFRYLLNRQLAHSEIMKWYQKEQMRKARSAPAKVDSFSSFMREIVVELYLKNKRRTEKDAEAMMDLLLRVSNPRRALTRLKVPTFILHAKDDPLCQIEGNDIAFMARVANANPDFRFHVTELGGHTAYVVVHPSWFYRVVKNYFTYWGRWEVEKRPPVPMVDVQALKDVQRQTSAPGGRSSLSAAGEKDSGSDALSGRAPAESLREQKAPLKKEEPVS